MPPSLRAEARAPRHSFAMAPPLFRPRELPAVPEGPKGLRRSCLVSDLSAKSSQSPPSAGFLSASSPGVSVPRGDLVASAERVSTSCPATVPGTSRCFPLVSRGFRAVQFVHLISNSLSVPASDVSSSASTSARDGFVDETRQHLVVSASNQNRQTSAHTTTAPTTASKQNQHSPQGRPYTPRQTAPQADRAHPRQTVHSKADRAPQADRTP